MALHNYALLSLAPLAVASYLGCVSASGQQTGIATELR